MGLFWGSIICRMYLAVLDAGNNIESIVIDAELHLVHRSPVDQSLAVVGVLLQAQAKNVPFFKYLTVLRKKVHVHQAQHVLHLEDGLSNVIADVIEDDIATSIEDAEVEDEVDGDELVDGGEDAEGDEEQDEQGYKFNNTEAEYNAEDETDFASQAFDAEPSEDENQVDINASIVETITLDNLDKNKDKDKDSQNINNQNNNDNNDNKQNKKSQQDLFIFSDNNESNNNNGDNNEDSQETNSAYAPSSSPEEILSSEAEEKCNLPHTADDIICADIPPTDEEAIHVELPLKSVDFSALIKTTKGLTFRWEYSGSLTTPPCSEHVAWNVMHEPFPIGLEQLRALVDLQGYNARQINEDQQAKHEPVA
ncbi:hypothetical protein BGX24_005817 [Mortierella sp. AD032]|nr:hypothetical protein BGX24_005817 [Mortierella sp. AD032]